jgi:hypothetical protein
VKNSTHIDLELLHSFAKQEGSSAGAEMIAHLGRCDVCAERYVQTAIGETGARAAAPEELWTNIQVRLQGQERAQPIVPTFGSRYRFALIATAALLLFVLIPARVFFYHKQIASLDLGRYIAVLEKTSAAPNAQNLEQTFADFVPYDQQAALQETALPDRVEGYRLAKPLVLGAGRARIFELIYDSPTDSFVIFVAPLATKISFAQYDLVDAQFKEIHCRRVQCPRQDIFWSQTRGRHFIFLRRRSSTGQSETLFSKLLSTGS